MYCLQLYLYTACTARSLRIWVCQKERGSGRRLEHHPAEESKIGQNSRLVTLATEHASVATIYQCIRRSTLALPECLTSNTIKQLQLPFYSTEPECSVSDKSKGGDLLYSRTACRVFYVLLFFFYRPKEFVFHSEFCYQLFFFFLLLLSSSAAFTAAEEGIPGFQVRQKKMQLSAE